MVWLKSAGIFQVINLFPKPIAFINLRGDASEPQLQKQVNFICQLSAVNVVLLSSDILKEDATREGEINILKKLSAAEGEMIILQTNNDMRDFKEKISEALMEPNLKVLTQTRNRSAFIKTIKQNLHATILSTTDLKTVSLKFCF